MNNPNLILPVCVLCGEQMTYQEFRASRRIPWGDRTNSAHAEDANCQDPIETYLESDGDPGAIRHYIVAKPGKHYVFGDGSPRFYNKRDAKKVHSLFKDRGAKLSAPTFYTTIKTLADELNIRTA